MTGLLLRLPCAGSVGGVRDDRSSASDEGPCIYHDDRGVGLEQASALTSAL